MVLRMNSFPGLAASIVQLILREWDANTVVAGPQPGDGWVSPPDPAEIGMVLLSVLESICKMRRSSALLLFFFFFFFFFFFVLCGVLACWLSLGSALTTIWQTDQRIIGAWRGVFQRFMIGW